MTWPWTVAEADVVIVREEGDRPRFVVHSRRGAQFLCRTYREATDRALGYAQYAHVCAWYISGSRLELLCHSGDVVADKAGNSAGGKRHERDEAQIIRL